MGRVIHRAMRCKPLWNFVDSLRGFSARIHTLMCVTTMPNLKSKSSELIERINRAIMELGEAPEKSLIDALVLNIEPEISKLEKAGRTYEARQAQGMLAALKCDVVAVRRLFSAADRISGGLPDILYNYSHALNNLYLYREAKDVIERALDKCPSEPQYLKTAVETCYSLFDFAGARAFMEKLRLLGKDACLSDGMASYCDRKESLLIKSGADGKEARQRIELAVNVVHESEIHSVFLEEILNEDSILYRFGILADSDVAMKVEGAIQRAIANQPYSPADRLLAFSCVPA